LTRTAIQKCHLKRWQRQAAGPLTENLPNVCLFNDLRVLTDSFHRKRGASLARRNPPSGNAESSLFALVCLAPLPSVMQGAMF